MFFPPQTPPFLLPQGFRESAHHQDARVRRLGGVLSLHLPGAHHPNHPHTHVVYQRPRRPFPGSSRGKQRRRSRDLTRGDGAHEERRTRGVFGERHGNNGSVLDRPRARRVLRGDAGAAESSGGGCRSRCWAGAVRCEQAATRHHRRRRHGGEGGWITTQPCGSHSCCAHSLQAVSESDEWYRYVYNTNTFSS